MPTAIPSIETLQKALRIAEQIEQLEQQFRQIMGTGYEATSAVAEPRNDVVEAGAWVSSGRRKGMRKLSAEARAKIAAAQKARWANQKGASAGPATALVMEAEKSAKKARGRLAAGASAAKAEKKKPLISKEVLARMAAKARELKRVR